MPFLPALGTRCRRPADQTIIEERRRRSDLITPVPKPKKRRRGPGQTDLVLATRGRPVDRRAGIQSDPDHQRDPRATSKPGATCPIPTDGRSRPETARLLQHWRHHQFDRLRPFFCQIEAVETVIWLTEVAPKRGQPVAKFWTHIEAPTSEANPNCCARPEAGDRRRQDDRHGDADRLADA